MHHRGLCSYLYVIKEHKDTELMLCTILMQGYMRINFMNVRFIIFIFNESKWKKM